MGSQRQKTLIKSIGGFTLVEVLIAPGQQSPQTIRFDEAGFLPYAHELLTLLGLETGRTPLNVSFVLALVIAWLVWLFLWRTRWGYEMRAVCANQAAASCGPPVCGMTTTQDCCIPGGLPGCNSQACCEAVCNVDPFCCDVAWDGICADAAQKSCEVCQGPGEDGECICVDNQLCENRFDIEVDVQTPGNSCEDDCCNDGEASCGSSEGADVWYNFTTACPNGGSMASASTTCFIRRVQNC